MSDIECPQCKKILKDSARRLVQDSCGHKKCRLCLLADETGCQQCSKDKDKCINNNSDTSINAAKFIEDLKIEKHQTTVITCNKFCVKNKTPIVNNSLTTNKNEVEDNAQPQNEICNKDVVIQTQPNKRKYDLFTLPSHITVIKNNGEQYKCNVCQKTFYTKYYVNNHKYCAEGTKPFCCDKCKKSFATKSQLEAHVLVHLDVTPYTCNICTKSFKEKSKLKRHKLTHTKSTSFMCQICGKGFKSKDYLKIHSYIHEEEKPFKCKTCNIKFSNSSNLKKHLLKHSKEKNHMCDQCGKRFKSRWSLTVHRRSHARLRVHNCSECSKAFINAKELRRHLLTHIDLKPYCCGSCETSFRRKDNLERHIKNTHPGKKVVAVTKGNIEELIKNKLNASKVIVEPIIKEKPNAIKVITTSNFNRTPSVISSTVNCPPKLAFKTNAFKSNYNIHGREYNIDSTPRPYDANESVNICKKILSPYSVPSTSAITSPAVATDCQSTKIYENILNPSPIDPNLMRPYGNLKFKLPTNYKNSSKNDSLPKPDIEPVQPSHNVPKISSLTSLEPKAVPHANNTIIINNNNNNRGLVSNELPYATSVIVNSPYTQRI